MRRVFRKGFAEKVARTSVLKHYGLKTLLYGVLLPGPDIGREAGDVMRAVHDAGFEVGLHTYDHVRWQDNVVGATDAWTRIEFERGMNAFKQVFGFYPQSHAAAGWQINSCALQLEREFGLQFASDTRGQTPFWPKIAGGRSSCPQLPTTLPTFDELLGRDGVEEANLAEAVFRLSQAGTGTGTGTGRLQVFTLHAELEGMLLLNPFESLLRQWLAAGVTLTQMAAIRDAAILNPMPEQTVILGEVPGRSGRLALQPSGAGAA
jgi:peptidoglycan/xylan/chitin deacetylase (PgdA/CDA1 family)